MDIIWLLVVIAIIGVVTWLLVTMVPMPPIIATLIIVVAVIGCIVLALRAFGVGPPGPNMRV